MPDYFRNPQLEGSAFEWPGTTRAEIGVVLSHGFTATTAEVRLLAQRLHAAGYTVAGPLLPGHGTTPEDLNSRRWPEWVAALEAAYLSLAARCRRVFVGGESMGGVLALQVASRHPEIAGVLLYAPGMQINHYGQALAAAALSRFLPFRAKIPGPPNATDAVWQGYDVYPTRALGQFLRLQWDTRRRLPRVTQPLLIFQGRRDTTVHPLAGRLIEAGATAPRQALHWLEHSTHCVLLDVELPRITELTLAFLEREAESG